MLRVKKKREILLGINTFKKRYTIKKNEQSKRYYNI